MAIFQCLGIDINITEDRLNYNVMRQEFVKFASQAEAEFRQLYKQNTNLDAVIKNVSEQGATVFQQVVTEKVMPLIVQMGIYTIDEQAFLEKYYFVMNSNYSFDEAVLELSDVYFEIVLDKENLDAYRVARRESRGRLVGGGYGVAGATKGILLAGAGNMISGGLHRVANGMGSMITSIQVAGKKNKIFRNPDVLEKLAGEFYLSVFRLHYAFYDFVKLNVNNIELRAVTRDEHQQASAILKNIQTNRVDQDKVIPLCAEVIKLNPYNYDVYKELLKRYGDKNNGVGELAELFGFNCITYKEFLLNQFFNQLSLGDKEISIQSRHELKEYQEFLAVKDTSLLRKIDVIINDFTLKEIESKINFCDMNSLLVSLEEINEVSKIETEYKRELTDKINKKIEEIDIANRTFEDILYSSEEEAKRAKFEKEELIKLFNNLDYNNEQEVLEFFEGMKERSERGVYTTESALRYVKEKVNEIVEKVNDLRTVEGVYYKTYEEASVARKKADKLNELLTETNGDIEKIIELSEREFECDDARLLEAYKEKLRQVISDKKDECESIINYSNGMPRRIFNQLKELIGGTIGAIVISLIFSATWIKVICGIAVIVGIGSFISEVFVELSNKVQKQSKVAEAKKQLQLIEESVGKSF